MILLRLLADILLYLVLGLVVYWFVTDDITLLWIAVGCALISAMLFILTADIRRLQHRRQSAGWNIWDWIIIIEWLEMPFILLRWLLMGLWRIFD